MKMGEEAMREWRAVAATGRGSVRGRRGPGWSCRAGISRTWTQGSSDRPCSASADRLHPGLLNCKRPFRARVDGEEGEGIERAADPLQGARGWRGTEPIERATDSVIRVDAGISAIFE